TRLQTNALPRLGLGWLKRVNLIVDYTNGDFIISPRKNFDADDLDMSGMEIARGNEKTSVVSVLKGSPADKAGIQSGDRILEIDGQNSDRLSISVVRKRLRRDDNALVKVVVARMENVILLVFV